ncbi:hypothetical protein Glove_606g10 [Diversispora epigaea]|uniref:Uncharacterized protein n=1 Tax=Diversispora epigaea TaxID=1348612 RepID=A0A397GAB3_9GLOM|nr:hypothetical protein Glove_606g10 [Diversispora epigaea]
MGIKNLNLVFNVSLCWELGRNQGVGVEKRFGLGRLLPCIDIWMGWAGVKGLVWEH